MNVAEYLVRAAALYSSRPAVSVGAKVVYDYTGLLQRVAGFAAELRRCGVGKGDRVLVFLENRPEFIEAMLASWWVGASIVPLNVKLHANELAYILSHSKAALSVISRKTEGTLAEAWRIAERKADYLIVDDLPTTLQADGLSGPESLSSTNPAWIFYTSGTTGKPKGAVLSHGNIQFASMNVRSDLDLGMHNDSLFHAAPMSHGSGLCVLAYMIGGACHVIPESGGFDASEIHSLIRAYRNCCIFAPPTLVHRLTTCPDESPAANVKTILYGGGPMHLATLQAALERFGPVFLQLYAQGECPMTITTLPKWAHSDVNNPRYYDRLASVGLPVTGAEVRTVDDQNKPLPRGEVGEIVVSSPAMMVGYFLDPKATEEAIIDGWLKTGDIGVFDADGFLYLKDRSKEMIISGGTNIYTKEVEDVILQHPSVQQVAVVAKSDMDWGEIPVAFVVAKGGGKIDLRDVDKHCLSNLSRFKRPKFYKLIDALPVNGLGKVLKRELKTKIAEDRDFAFDLDVSRGS